MPGYVAKALNRFQTPTTCQTRTFTASVDCTHSQMVQVRKCQSLQIRLLHWPHALLYYARSVDCTMLVALEETAPTTHATAKAITQQLNYAATHPDAVLLYRASDMILHVHLDASYQSESQSSSLGWWLLLSQFQCSRPY
jgi:hypothetical protein